MAIASRKMSANTGNNKMTEYKYQTKDFTCKKCGIKFEVHSDSKIIDTKYCSDCKNADNYRRTENG